jgi:hypothetical protein
MTEKRKARIESAFEIQRPGLAPLSVTPGVCWIEPQDREVALHLGRDIGHQVVHVSHLQFQQSLNNHQLVFMSW